MRLRRLILLLLGVVLAASAPASAQLSDEEAVAVFDRVQNQAIKVSRFQGQVEIIRKPEFLGEFFLQNQFYGNKTNVPGVVNKAQGGVMHLYLRDEGPEFQHFTANGMSVGWIGRELIMGTFDAKQKPKPIEEQVAGQVLDGASPSPAAEPAASPEASASPAGPTGPAWDRLSPRSRELVDFHPLIFLWPYDLLTWNAAAQYRLKSDNEIVFGMKCDLLEQRVPGQEGAIQLWVARDSGQVAKISVPDPNGGPPLEATYSRFGPADQATGYRPWSHLEVTQGIDTLYQAVMTEAKVNPDMADLLKADDVPATGAAVKPPVPQPPLISDPKVWTLGILFSAGLLATALMVLAGRFARFRLTRQVFSREIIVLDEEDSNFSELLEGYGISVKPFAPDVLTLERNRLGKGLTAEGTEQPRAVIVGPDAFAEGKGYFFLLEAYLREGGRVMVLPHGPKTVGKIPMKVELVPLPSVDTFQATGIWRTSEPEQVERAASMLADRNGILRVDGKPLEQVFLKATAGDIQAPLIGVHRRGKGEVLFCQLHLEKGGAVGARLLTDLLGWVQGRTKL